MKKKCRKIFNRLETQRKENISQYRSLTIEQLRYNPGPGEWNLLQVLRHVVTAEKQSLILIQRSLNREESIAKTGIGSAVRHLLLKLALTLPMKFKAPKIAEVSEEYPDFEEMIDEWQQVREEIREIIEKYSEEMLGKEIYRHPRAGYLNMKQALEFMEIHTSHHQKQVGRIKKSQAGFPSE